MVYFDQTLLQMYVNIFLPLACVTALLMEEGLLSIISAGCCQFVNMLKALEPHHIYTTLDSFPLLVRFKLHNPCMHMTPYTD